jgi:hypothetical protein
MAKKSTAIATRDDDDYSLAVVVPDFLQGVEHKGILADVEIQQNYLRVSLGGERFTIMDGRNEVEELGEEISVRFIHIHPAVQRAQYEQAYDAKAEEWQPPRCYSNDGVTPASGEGSLASKCLECPFAKKETTPKGENTCSQFRNAVVQVQFDKDEESEPMILKIGAMSHWTPPSSGDNEELNFQRLLKWADRGSVMLEIYPIELQFDGARDANHQLTFIPVGNRPLVGSQAEFDELQGFIADNKSVFDDMCTLDFSNANGAGDNSEENTDTSEDEKEEREPPKRQRRSNKKKTAAKEKPPAEEPADDDGGEGDASESEDAVQAAPPTRTRRTRRSTKSAAATTPAATDEGEGEGADDGLPDDLKDLIGNVETV